MIPAWHNPLEYSARPVGINLGLLSRDELTAVADSGDGFAKAELERRNRIHDDAYLNWRDANG